VTEIQPFVHHGEVTIWGWVLLIVFFLRAGD
jgi:hypothetical protein